MSKTIAVRLPMELVNEAKIYAEKSLRSVPKQIEFWTKVGRAAKDNPDLPIEFIEGVLEAKDAVSRGEVSPFEFRQD